MNRLNKKQFVIYIIAVLVLFGIPIFTILINTSTLKDGTEYYFKIEAYDPYDMFRGNYLNVAFEQDTIESSRQDVKYFIKKQNQGLTWWYSG